jgi:acid stress chaperone HdeA
VKRGVVVTLAAAVLLTQSGLAFAQSSPARKPGRQMTCGDFLLVDDTVKPEMVYWAATRDPRGGLVNTVIGVDATDRIVPRLVERCREAPNAPFWQTVKAETGKLREEATAPQ